MANVRLTERSDGTIYLQCRCAEIGYPCEYQGAVSFAPEGLTLLRQARIEAFEHCWAAHKVPAHAVQFDVSYYTEQAPAPASTTMRPTLVTTEPQKTAPAPREATKANG